MQVPAIVVETVSTEFTPDAPDLARRMPPLPGSDVRSGRREAEPAGQ